MDYFAKIQESLIFAWRHKKLWVLGFLASLGSGFGSYGNGNYGDSSSSWEESDFDFLESGVTLAIICCVFVLAFILSLVFWYLAQAANAGLIIASAKEDNKEEVPGLKEAWKLGRAKAFKLMLLDLIMLVVIIAMSVVSIPAIILFPLICCLMIVYIPIFIMIWIIMINAERVIVLENTDAIEAIKRSFNLVKLNIGDFLLASLAYILVAIAWIIILMPLFILIFVLVFAMIAVNSVIFAIFMIMILVVLLIISAVINAGYQVFVVSYFTKVYLALKNKVSKE